MAPKVKKKSSSSLELIEYKVDELQTAQDRTEGKVDQIKSTISNLQFVSIVQYEEDKKKFVRDELLESKVTEILNKRTKNYRAFVISVGTATAIYLATQFLNFIANGGLQR